MKRPNGTGSVFYLSGQNRWIAAITLETGHTKRVRVKTKEEAEQKVVELLHSHKRLDPIPRPDPSTYLSAEWCTPLPDDPPPRPIEGGLGKMDGFESAMFFRGTRILSVVHTRTFTDASYVMERVLFLVREEGIGLQDALDDRDVLMRTVVNARMSKRIRFFVLQRDGFQCVYCGARPPDVTLHVDHIRPWSHDGLTTMDNLASTCAACNINKKDFLLDPAMEELIRSRVAENEKNARKRPGSVPSQVPAAAIGREKSAL